MHQEQDGWQEEPSFQDQDSCLPQTFSKKESALSILKDQQHSLQPDMMFGWKPKLPSCPLPLSYRNGFVDEIIKKVEKDDRYQLTYLGPRYVNSVQVNQQYQYSWKYRSRYSLNIALVQNAIQKIGSNHHRTLNLQPAEFKFDSSFESGNLDAVIRVKKYEYDCFLRSDTNTQGHTSWFYFKVENGEHLGSLQMNICNFGKTNNLYNQGMRPYSLNKKGEWSQIDCYDVNFVERYCRYSFETKTYQLQFKFDFTSPNQSIFFASSIPYTYSKLHNFINLIQLAHPKKVHSEAICESLGGVDLPLLIISNFAKENESLEQQLYSGKKKCVLLTARIHPGESNSSHLMEGFITSLLADTSTAEFLRNSFTFYIVPMLNPDGVIAGNFRTSYSGKDLNRQFQNLNKFIFPEITALHGLAIKLKKLYRSKFQFFFDFHGHSSKKGLFCYGPEHNAGKIQFFKCRALAKMMEEETNLFSYKRSIFTISEHKRTTARAHMLQNIKIPMTFTFQMSNGLYELEKKSAHLSLLHLLQSGKSIVNVFFKYARIQMNIPFRSTSAKIDSGILKKSTAPNAKFSKGKKPKTLKELSNNFPNLQKKDEKSSKNLRATWNEQKDEISSIEKVERQNFLRVMAQIKQECFEKKNISEEMEGGSDSQASEEDLDKENLRQLYQLIENKDNKQTYQKLMRWELKNSASWRAPQDPFGEEDKSTPKSKIITSSKYLEIRKSVHLKTKRKSAIDIVVQKAAVPGKNFAMQF